MSEFAAVLEADGVSHQQLLEEVSMTDALLVIFTLHGVSDACFSTSQS